MADLIRSLFRCVAISRAPNRTRPAEPRYAATCVLLVAGVPAPERTVMLYSSSPDAFRIDGEYLVDSSLTVVAWQDSGTPDVELAPPPTTASA